MRNVDGERIQSKLDNCWIIIVYISHNCWIVNFLHLVLLSVDGLPLCGMRCVAILGANGVIFLAPALRPKVNRRQRLLLRWVCSRARS